MTEDDHGTQGEQGPVGPEGPQGPPGDPAPVEKVQPGYEFVARFMRAHPKFRGPSIITIVLWVALVVGAGVYLLSVSRAQDAVARVHNISACTLRSYLSGVRVRQVQTADDQTLSATARDRAKDSVKGIDVLLSSQVTTPASFNCKKLLADLAAKKKAETK